MVKIGRNIHHSKAGGPEISEWPEVLRFEHWGARNGRFRARPQARHLAQKWVRVEQIFETAKMGQKLKILR